MWIFPKIADFGIFDGFLAKNPPELSGDAVPTEHQIHGKGVISVSTIEKYLNRFYDKENLFFSYVV